MHMMYVGVVGRVGVRWGGAMHNIHFLSHMYVEVC